MSAAAQGGGCAAKLGADLLGEALALLFPIDWPEPFGLVMIESLACGRPVVATTVGAVPEMLAHRELRAGILVPPLPNGQGVAVDALAAILQQAVFSVTGLGTFEQVASGDALIQGLVALLFGQLSTIVGTILVTAAAADALERIDEGGRPDALAAYRRSGRRVGSLAWAWTRVIVVAGLLTITVVGIPFAIFYLVRKTVVTQACVMEDRHATASLRRSTELVKGHGFRVLAIAACVNVTAYLLGPIVAMVFLFLTPSSLSLINVISSLVYVVVMPYVGIAIALLFYDLRRREAEAPAREPAVVPVQSAAT